MDKMDDEMKNQFDALAILWKGAWEQFNERRKIEFQVSLAVWTALVTMTVVVISKSIEVANFKIEKDIALASIVALSWAFFFYLRWILGLANANKKDREIAKHYEKYLQRLSQSHFGYGLQISLKRGGLCCMNIFYFVFRDFAKHFQQEEIFMKFK